MCVAYINKLHLLSLPPTYGFIKGQEPLVLYWLMFYQNLFNHLGLLIAVLKGTKIGEPIANRILKLTS